MIVEGNFTFHNKGVLQMALDTKTEFGTARQMIEADTDFSRRIDDVDLVRVDLACGKRKKEGFIGIDKVATEQTDKVHDLLQFPWPFADKEVYEFNCEHFVEHIPMTLSGGENGLIRFMEEAYRCLMPGGTIRIVAPYYSSIEAWQDPTHVRAISERTFVYFDQKAMQSADLDHYSIRTNFEAVSRIYRLHPECEAFSEERRNYMIKYYMNVVQEFEIVLRKKPMNDVGGDIKAEQKSTS